MVKQALVVLGLAAAVAACSGSTTSGAPPGRHHVEAAAAVADPITTTTDPLDAYNPEHDPNKCVKILDNGFVVITLKVPIPPDAVPNPAVADEPITPVPDFGKCG